MGPLQPLPSFLQLAQKAGIWNQLPAAAQQILAAKTLPTWAEVDRVLSPAPRTPIAGPQHAVVKEQLRVLVTGYARAMEARAQRTQPTQPTQQTASSNIASNLDALLQRRASIGDRGDEPDYTIERREVLSASFVAEVEAQAAPGRVATLKQIAEKPNLDVSGLRTDALIGLNAIHTGELSKRFVPGNKSSKTPFVCMPDFHAFYTGRGLTFLENLFVTTQYLQYVFSYPMDLDGVARLLQQNPRFEVTQSAKRDTLLVTIDGSPALHITHYSVVVLTEGMLDQPNLLMRAINVATRVVEAVHDDRLISSDYQVVRMFEFKPFMDALLDRKSPSLFRGIGEHILSKLDKVGKDNTLFPETRRSFAQRDKALWLWDKRGQEGAKPVLPASYNVEKIQKPPHTTYVLIEKGAKPEEGHQLVFGMDMSLDVGEMEKAVKATGMQLTVEESLRKNRWVARGGRIPSSTTIWTIYRGEGEGKRPVLEFTRQTITVPVDGDAEHLKFAAALLDHLGNTGVYQAATMKAGHLKAGLSSEELKVLPAWNIFARIYQVVISLKLEIANAEEMRRGGPYARTPEAHKWAATVMKLAPTQTVEGRYMHLLKQALAMCNSEEMRNYGERGLSLMYQLETHIKDCERVFGQGGSFDDVFGLSDKAKTDDTDTAPQVKPATGLAAKPQAPRPTTEVTTPNQKKVLGFASEINAYIKLGPRGVVQARDRVGRALNLLAMIQNEQERNTGPTRRVHAATMVRFMEAAGRGIDREAQLDLQKLISKAAKDMGIQVEVS
ncbi:MAG: hypothetical protein HQM16_08410 [Deltaproteobacteria bacterium]|nr:hypothetical protein [Deltaproteobacteria bacterium]